MFVKILVGSIVGGIVMFLLGFLVYGILLDAYMKASMVQYAGLLKDPPNMVALFLFNVAWAAVLAIVIVKYSQIIDFAGGFVAGALVFFFVSLGIDLSFVAFMNMFTGFMPVVVDVIAAAILGGITGGVIALVNARLGKTATA